MRSTTSRLVKVLNKFNGMGHIIAVSSETSRLPQTASDSSQTFPNFVYIPTFQKVYDLMCPGTGAKSNQQPISRPTAAPRSPWLPESRRARALAC
jgi:hypothetical protein